MNNHEETSEDLFQAANLMEVTVALTWTAEEGTKLTKKYFSKKKIWFYVIFMI